MEIAVGFAFKVSKKNSGISKIYMLEYAISFIIGKDITIYLLKKLLNLGYLLM